MNPAAKFGGQARLEKLYVRANAQAAERRKNIAQGASPGYAVLEQSQAPEGRKTGLVRISGGFDLSKLGTLARQFFLRPFGAGCSRIRYPGLTPWAGFCRRFAALRNLPIILMPLAFAGCRSDMQDQPRFKPLAESDFYVDLRSARPPVEGTVARGQLREDAYFYSGKIGNNPGDYMPFPVTEAVLARGRQRFNIFCTPCHSRLGDGNGVIVQRGYRRPPSFHIERLRQAPLGYFFDVATNGFGAMPDYASQIPPRDRWCIVAYIRALQLSQNAVLADVPAGQKVPSEPPQLEQPGSGATLPVTQPKPQAKNPEEKNEEPK